MSSPIDVFVTYDEKKAQDIAISRYATRHLIAAEVRSVNHLYMIF
jgi:chromosome transmission fidelity protein 18